MTQDIWDHQGMLEEAAEVACRKYPRLSDYAREVARDATITAAHRHPDKLKSCGFGYWVQVANNALINELRREGLGRKAMPDLYQRNVVSRRADPQAIVEGQEKIQVFEQCRTRLPERLKVVLNLHLEGLTGVMISERLGVSPSNVSDRLAEAKDELKNCMSKRGYSSDTES